MATMGHNSTERLWDFIKTSNESELMRRDDGRVGTSSGKECSGVYSGISTQQRVLRGALHQTKEPVTNEGDWALSITLL